MPDDGDLNKMLDNYATFGKRSKGQREPAKVAKVAPPAPRPGTVHTAAQAQYNFDHAGDWLNRYNDKKSSPKLVVKAGQNKAAKTKRTIEQPRPEYYKDDLKKQYPIPREKYVPKPKKTKQVADNLMAGAPDDGSV